MTCLRVVTQIQSCGFEKACSHLFAEFPVWGYFFLNKEKQGTQPLSGTVATILLPNPRPKIQCSEEDGKRNREALGPLMILLGL